MQPNGTGLLIPELVSPQDWRMGGITGLVDTVVLQDDGQWDEFLPIKEMQYNGKFDTMACVTFSNLNCFETIVARKFDIRTNFSDRFTAKMSGTTELGNYATAVADSVRKDGLVLESDWAFTPEMDRATYYSEIPQEIKDRAKLMTEKYQVRYDYVYQDQLSEALRYSPVQIAIKYPANPDANGIYHRVEGAANHMVECYGFRYGAYWKVYDHYTQDKKKLAWNYDISFGLRFDITLKSATSMIDLPNNQLVQQAGPGANGAFAMHLDKKLFIIPDVTGDPLLRTIEIRNGRGTAITKEQWDAFPKYDLRTKELIPNA